MKKLLLILITVLLIGHGLSAQTVNIPDPNFKAALVANLAINTNGDGEIQVSEAEGYEGAIDVKDKRILSLVGIETFAAISSLDCSRNQLSSLDVSANLQLETLICYDNQLASLDLSANSTLKRIESSYNQLVSLNIENISGLVRLNCAFNQLVSLDVSANSVLEVLICDHNQLVGLDLSGNSQLKFIYCKNNQLINLNVSGASVLDHLICDSNELSTLDVGGNPTLNVLSVSNNQLTSLNVGSNANLTQLSCGNNQLTELDVSNNPILGNLFCPNNQLISLNVQNGNNTNIGLNARNNPGLICVQVDDPEWAFANLLDNIDLSNAFHTDYTAIFSTNCSDGAVLAIPDDAFKAALLNNPGINTNGDGEIQLSEAEAYSGAIDVAGLNITDLTGIEAFISINALDCSDNQIGILNVSRNPNLEYLDGSVNQLWSLNVKNGNNISFSYFDARGNPDLDCIQVDDTTWAAANWANFTDPAATFSTLCMDAELVFIPDPLFKAALVNNAAINANGDEEIQVAEAEAYEGAIDVSDQGIATLIGIEAFTAIDSLNCAENLLASLDVSSNSALKYLNTSECYLLGSLNISGCPDLVYLNCSENEAMTNLDVRSNPVLEHLNCNGNQLTSLDVSTNLALRILDCGYNHIPHLDLSNNPNWVHVLCRGNNLITLNVQNGNNANMHLDTEDNQTLRCIQVDDPEQAWEDWNYDTAGNAIYSTDCDAVVYIPDPNFKAALINNASINSYGYTEIQVGEAQSYFGAIYVSGLGITDLTGIEAFTRIRTLDCSDNQLASLDVRENRRLVNLNCSSNQITNLDVSGNTKLTRLDCSSNQLISLNAQNGNSLNTQFFDARYNPDLACIQVNYAGWMSVFWGEYIDPTATFSTDCETITGTAPSLEKASLSVYPNPTTGELTLALGTTYREVTVEVKDVMGRTLSRKVYDTINQLELTLDGPAGLYFVTVRAGNDEFIPVRVVKY